MGVLANIIIALTAKTDGFERGTKKAGSFVDQLGHKFNTKLIGAIAIIHAVDRGINGLADALEKARDDGESFGDALTNSLAGFAENLPLIGGAVRVFEFVIQEITGMNSALRGLNAELDEANDKIAANEIRARKASSIIEILKKLEGDIKFHGVAPELRGLMEEGASDAAIARAKELIRERGQLLAGDRHANFPTERRFVGPGGRVPGGVQNALVTIHSRHTVIMGGTVGGGGGGGAAEPTNGGGAW